jgi:hypothetical protein
MIRTGHCLCGAVTFSIQGPETWACHCHCADCRRQTASPVTTFLGIPLDRFQWTGQQPKTYVSSPGVTRSFCDTCGTPMAFQADRYAGEIHLYDTTLTDPETFSPKFHVHYDAHLPWLDLNDSLPRHAKFAT